LLIEDDADQVNLYTTKFDLEGLKYLTANNGRQGIDLAKKNRPDLILLDIVMAEMDGMEVLKQLKTDKETNNIPIVLLTNLVNKQLLREAENLGVCGFWAKIEVMPCDIVAGIKKILEIK
jgi:CheY-like chemotaxis protein